VGERSGKPPFFTDHGQNRVGQSVELSARILADVSGQQHVDKQELNGVGGHDLNLKKLGRSNWKVKVLVPEGPKTQLPRISSLSPTHAKMGVYQNGRTQVTTRIILLSRVLAITGSELPLTRRAVSCSSKNACVE